MGEPHDLEDDDLAIVTGGVGAPSGIGASKGGLGEIDPVLLEIMAKNGMIADPKDGKGAQQALNSLSGMPGGGDMYAIMSLFQKMAQEQRNTARDMRSSERESQISQQMAAAEQIRSSAQASIVAGMMQSISSGGLAGAGMTGRPAKGAVAEAMEKAGEGGSGKFAGRSDIMNGIGQGIGGIVAGSSKYQAESDVESSRREAEAKLHETATGHANDMMQQMQDVIRDIRDKLQDIQQAQIETSRGIARNI